MSLTIDQKGELRGRGQSLWTRISASSGHGPLDVEESADEILASWAENVAYGETEEFRRRLAVDDLTISAVASRLGPVEHRPMPDWVEFVDDLVEYLETEGDFEVDVSTASDEENPFEHLIDPIVEFAFQRLDREQLSERLSESALAAGGDVLARELRLFYTHPLFIEFKLFLDSNDAGAEGDPDSRAGYRAFVQRRLDDGLASFFVEYTVLARWTAVVVEQWIASFEEFSERVDADWEALEELVDPDGDLGDIVDVESRGDRHHHGRRVIGVTFASGDRVAYKPRGVGPEARYNEFLSWINRASSLPDLRTAGCLARDGYGWMEWIEPTDCTESESVARYFERAGVLTCLLYVLRFTDGNIENIVAAGDQPVVLDLEAILQPKLPDEHRFAPANVHSILDDSVLHTGILPLELHEMQGTQGLYAERGEQTKNAPEYTDVNTDAMDLHFDDTVYIEGNSLPRLDGEAADPSDYVDELVAGFEAAYEFVLDSRDRLLAEDGPLELFADLETRFFYRSTSIYGVVRSPLMLSGYLRSGLTAGLRIEQLTRWIDWERFHDGWWDVYETERDALWRFDIPRFTVNTSERHAYLEDRTIESLLDRTPLEQLRQRIEALDRADLRRQKNYFVAGYDANRLRNPTPETDEPVIDSTPEWEPLAERTCLEIVEKIRETAYRTDDGHLIWYDRVNHGDGIYIRPCRDGLYGGRMGTALFAGAVATRLGREPCRDLAAEAIAPIREDIREDESRFVEKRLGAAHGLGSLIYGFTKLGTWFDDQTYVDDALELSTYVTEERALEDDRYDVIGGAAGAILGLLELYEKTGDQAVLDRAIVAGDALLENRVEVDGFGVWETHGGDQPTLVGPAHGIAGIALALFRLGETVDASRFTEAALDSLRFEEAHYRPDEQNWPDFRFDRCRQGWCAGRSGIGLSRLGMLEVDEHAVARRDFERALDGLDSETLGSEDHLCCGNCSRIEFLLRTSEFLDDEQYRRQAERLAAAVVRRADRNGGYSIPWQTENWYTDSMFLGEPGVGYTLLRLAGADLPCLLLWE